MSVTLLSVHDSYTRNITFPFEDLFNFTRCRLMIQRPYQVSEQIVLLSAMITSFLKLKLNLKGDKQLYFFFINENLISIHKTNLAL